MASPGKKKDSLPVLTNSKARHKFALGEKYEAGIVLSGTEVKSIRAGKAQISESYAKIIREELFLCNAHIAEYEYAGYKKSASFLKFFHKNKIIKFFVLIIFSKLYKKKLINDQLKMNKLQNGIYKKHFDYINNN